MPVKLLMNWDIKPGRDQEYFEFMVREWLPGLQRLGLEPSENWLTIYGRAPQIMMGVLAHNLRSMRQVMGTEEWRALKNQLLDLVDNYDQKVVRALNSFQM